MSTNSNGDHQQTRNLEIETEILRHRRHLEAILRLEGGFMKSLEEAAWATYLNTGEAPVMRRRFSDLLDTVFYNRVLSFRINALIKDLELAKSKKGTEGNRKRARGEG